MALYYELQVFKDVYTLVQKVFLYTQEFPREYKYTLGQDMKRDSIQLVRSIYRANKAKDKVVYLETFNMSSLVRATYFLKVSQNNTSLKTFKIIKN